MGSKNCPETPRQRMIGMMYLVLTAMLALNVSADVLEAFTQVQESLSSTLTSIQQKNTESYNEIEMAYNLNETKVGPTREKGLVIREKTRELIKFVDDLKLRLVQIADGDDADVNNIKSKSNLDVGGQVMITQGQGKLLKEKLNEYREFILSNVDEKDSVLIATINHALDTQDPPAKDGEFKNWESSKFENIPLAGVVTMLTMYQTNILSVESDVIRYLISSVDAESFKFNKLDALIIPESRYVFSGDDFKARILLAAVDTTQQPEIMANGRKVKYQGDYGIYTERTSKLGIHKVKGVINYLAPSGQTLPRTFEVEYEVAEPAVVVSPTKMNVFYLGVDNPVSLAASGVPADAIVPEITNGSIVKKGHEYIVRPKRANQNCQITVYAMVNNQKKKLQTQEFRVKTVPDPITKVGDKRDGNINKNYLKVAGRLDVSMENFDFDMKFTVVGFNIYTVADGYIQSASTTGPNFSNDQLKLIDNLRRNQFLIIEKIQVKGPDGTVRTLPSMSFKID